MTDRYQWNMQYGGTMIKTQDIDLKELKFYSFEGIHKTWTTKEKVRQFLADKMNRIEKEIDNKKGEWEEFDNGMDEAFKIFCKEFTGK